MKIKARAYDIRQGIMSYETTDYLQDYEDGAERKVKGFRYNIDGESKFVTLQEAIESDNYEVRYCLGQEDIEGKEIYEGSILYYGKYTDDNTTPCLFIVEWDNECSSLSMKEVRDHKYFPDPDRLTGIDPYAFVVGNIDEDEIPTEAEDSWIDVSGKEEITNENNS